MSGKYGAGYILRINVSGPIFVTICHMSIKEKWNERYRDATGDAQASRVLRENLHLLPGNGRALDLACGSGGNAILLAQQGLKVDAWDIADVPIAALQEAALKQQLSIRAEVRDVEANPPAPETFDVIVVSYFLDRDTIPALVQALKPAGLIYYQTFTRQRVSERGPQREEFRLADQELLQLFSGLQILFIVKRGVLATCCKASEMRLCLSGGKGLKPDYDLCV